MLNSLSLSILVVGTIITFIATPSLAFLGCNEPPKWNPQMIDKALHNMYHQCNGKNWPSPYNKGWDRDADTLCALDGNERKHPGPYGTRCLIGPPWHKAAPDADGGLLFLENYNGAITGPLPDEFKAFQMTDQICLAGNKITGNFWDTSSHCFLHKLDLSHNEMSGVIEEKGFFSGSKNHLEQMNLGYNQFSGPIPSTINDLETLTALLLNNNKFSGKIPDLSHLGKLRHLDLRQNQLSGDIGLWMKELKNLAVLKLDYNPNLNGELPHLPDSISRFSASGTGFSGEIPASYGELPVLRHFNCTGCNIHCPSSKPDLFAHLIFSTHCKPPLQY